LTRSTRYFIPKKKKKKKLIINNTLICPPPKKKTSNWVQTSILHGKNLEERTALLKMYIKLAANLKEHNNFNGIMMIQAALESAGVHRLKKTWENLSKDKQKLFEDTVSTMSHVKNFGNYRALLQKCQPPSLPYVGTPNEAVVFLPSNPPFYFFFQSGLYMTDLTFMCDGNDDNISKKNSTVKQINVDKRRMLSKSTCLKKKFFFFTHAMFCSHCRNQAVPSHKVHV